MRLLQLCHKPPVPAIDGGCIAMNSITQGLIQNGQTVKVLAMETFKHRFQPNQIDPAYLNKTGFETVKVDIRVKALPALLNLFTTTSYNISRFYAEAFARRLTTLLQTETYDLIICESLYTSMYLDIIRKYSKAPVIYRSHNIEQKIWELHAQNAANPLKKAYLKLLHRRIKHYEDQTVTKFDSILAINEDEASYFRQLPGNPAVVTVPVGMATTQTDLHCTEKVSSFFHLGSMDWTPNQEGIRWFIEQVWPAIHTSFPQATLQLAGRKMPEWLAQLNQPQVTIHGEVSDAHEFIRNQEVMVVPLFSGSGLRVKILEAMALGKTVVCTSTAAAGIPFTAGKELLIANTPAAFIDTLSQLLKGSIDTVTIGKNAAALIRAEFDHEQLTSRLIDHFNNLLRTSANTPQRN
jgi:glycosyltransferase involved in cell wall biosynthesis